RRGRNRSAARPIREDLLRAAPPGHGELRPGREHGEAGHRRGGRAGRRGSAPEEMALRTPAPPRWAALAACLSLACWHGPTPAPLLPVAVLPLDAYGGAIYVPAVINGDSAWLMLDTARYRYKGAGTTVRFTPDADLPLLRAQVKVRGRRAIPARLLLDTGASGLCLILTTTFAEQHGLGRVAPAIEAPIGTGLVGE